MYKCINVIIIFLNQINSIISLNDTTKILNGSKRDIIYQLDHYFLTTNDIYMNYNKYITCIYTGTFYVIYCQIKRGGYTAIIRTTP